MAEYDLTQTLLAYLDPHLGLALLTHLSETDLFDAKALAKAQYELAKTTGLSDLARQSFQKACPGESVPQDIAQRQQKEKEVQSNLESEAKRVRAIAEDPKNAALLKERSSSPDWLQQNLQLTTEQADVLYHYGRSLYAIGEYKEASVYLYHYGTLVPTGSHTESSLWGRLAADVLAGEGERAADVVRLLREYIDAQRVSSHAKADADAPATSASLTHEDILLKRVWLLHWALFVFFQHAHGRTKLVELFLSPAYLSALQMSSWWLLRYLVAALILTRRQQSRGYMLDVTSSSSQGTKLTAQAAVREVAKVLHLESYRQRADPFVDFFRHLYAELDFEQAQKALALADKVARQDYFLLKHADAFVEQARLLIFEAYGRIHQEMDMADLAQRLNLSPEEGAAWILQHAGESKPEAHVDADAGVVRVSQSRPAVYQSVIEKARNVAARSSSLSQVLERRTKGRQEENEAEAEADHDMDVDEETAPPADA